MHLYSQILHLYCLFCSPFYNTSESTVETSGTTAAKADNSNSSSNNNSGGAGDSCVELATSVGSSALVGRYLSQQAALWSAACAIPSVAVQLRKAGTDAVECAEAAEQLLELANR